jgi:phage terminase small subunit
VILLPRAKNAKAETALNLYRQGVALIDIARQLDVPEGTVRRWKSSYGWTKDKANVRNDSERSEKIKANVRNDIASVAANEDLTEKQKRFCLFYVRSFNATKAYMKAYYCDYATAATNGCRLLEKAKIREEINRLKENRFQRELLSEADIFQKYLDIAFADMTDFVTFDGESNSVGLKDGSEIDGTLISEVRSGKQGTTIKLADRMRALDWLTEHMDIATEEQRARIAALKARSAAADPEDVDTSYVDALRELAGKVWDEQEG